MNDLAYPLLFTPVYMDYIWGGTRLAKAYGRRGTPPVCAESWEVADRPEGMSVVANGPLRGATLGELVAESPAQFVGANHARGPFPLLIKLIDARERLSVQVHPNDETARTHGGHAKTEAWFVLDAAADAGVYAGLARPDAPGALRRALADGTVETLLKWTPVRPGGAVFVPGGCLHAIGAGCLLLEVQQNSNTTYRVHDWGRVGADGKPRDLHIEEAMAVIDWHAAPPEFREPRPAGEDGGARVSEAVACPYFRIERRDLDRSAVLCHAGDSFSVLFGLEGVTTLRCGPVRERLTPGATALIPACCAETGLVPEAPGARILRICLGHNRRQPHEGT